MEHDRVQSDSVRGETRQTPGSSAAHARIAFLTWKHFASTEASQNRAAKTAQRNLPASSLEHSVQPKYFVASREANDDESRRTKNTEHSLSSGVHNAFYDRFQRYCAIQSHRRLATGSFASWKQWTRTRRALHLRCLHFESRIRQNLSIRMLTRWARYCSSRHTLKTLQFRGLRRLRCSRLRQALQAWQLSAEHIAQGQLFQKRRNLTLAALAFAALKINAANASQLELEQHWHEQIVKCKRQISAANKLQHHVARWKSATADAIVCIMQLQQAIQHMIQFKAARCFRHWWQHNTLARQELAASAEAAAHVERLGAAEASESALAEAHARSLANLVEEHSAVAAALALQQEAAASLSSEDMHRRLIWLVVSRKWDRGLVTIVRQWRFVTGNRLQWAWLSRMLSQRVGRLSLKSSFCTWWKLVLCDHRERKFVRRWCSVRVASVFFAWQRHCSRCLRIYLIVSGCRQRRSRHILTKTTGAWILMRRQQLVCERYVARRLRRCVASCFNAWGQTIMREVRVRMKQVSQSSHPPQPVRR